MRVGESIVAESAAIEVLTGGVGPTALTIGDGTQGVENADGAARAHQDDVVVGIGEGVVEGGAVQTARLAALKSAVDLHGPAAQGSGATGPGVEDGGSAPVDRGAAGVVVGVPEDDVAAACGGAKDVAELGPDEDAGRAGTAGGTEDVIGAGESQVRPGIASEAVGVARADAESGGQVIDLRGSVAAEEEGAVPDVREVQRGVERGNRQLKGRSAQLEAIDRGVVESAALANQGVQPSARVVIRIENDGREAADIAVQVQAVGGNSGKAPVVRDAQGAAGIHIDRTGAERRASGARHLDCSRVDVGPTREGVRSPGNPERAVGRGAAAELVETGGSADDTGQFQEGGAAAGGVDVGEGAVQRGRVRHPERITIPSREGQAAVGDRKRSDLNLVARVGGHTIDVDRSRAGHGDIEPAGGWVSIDDSAVGAAAVAVEPEFTALQGDRAGCRAIGAAQSHRILGDEDALVDGHAAGEAVLVGVGVVRGDVPQGQRAQAILDQSGGPSAAIDAVDDVADERGARVSTDGEGPCGVGGVSDNPGNAGQTRNGRVPPVDVELRGVVEDQPRRETSRGRGTSERQGAVVHGQGPGDGVIPGKSQGPGPGLRKGPTGDAAGDRACYSGVSTHVDDAFAGLRGDGGIDGQGEVGGRGGGCDADGDARAAGDRCDRRANGDARARDRLSDDEPGGALNRDRGRGVCGSTGQIDRGGQTVEDHVGTDRARAVDDQSPHVVGVHGAEAQGAAVDSSGGGEAEDVRRAGDAGGRGDVGDGGRDRTRKRVGQGEGGIGGDEAQDGIIGDKAGGLIRAGSEAQDGASGGTDIVAGEAADVVESGELLLRGGHLTEDGATEDTGVRANGVAEVAVHAGDDGQVTRTDTSESGGGELDVIAHHGIEAHVGATDEVDGRDGEGGTGAVGVHAEGTPVDRHGGVAKRSASGSLGQQGGTVADCGKVVCVGTGLVAVEDDRAWTVDGEEARTGGEGVVRVGLSRRDVDAAGTGHGEDAIRCLGGGNGKLAATKGNAARQHVQAADAAEVVVGADAEDTAVDRGGTEVGIGIAQDQGAEAGLGEAGLCADVSEVTADDARCRQGGRRAHVDGAALDQLHVVGDREVLIPTGQRARVEEDVPGKIASSAEGQGASADGGVGVGVRAIGEAEDTDASLDEGRGPGNYARQGDDTIRAGDVQGTVGGTGKVHGPAQGEVGLGLSAVSDETIRRESPDRVARAS